MHIPARVEDLTPDWLTQILSSTGVITHTTVATVEYIPLVADYNPQLFRLALSHRPIAADAPATVVAKIAPPGANLDIFKREIRFFNELAAGIPIRTPSCYYGAYDEATGHSVLLLEDLQEGRVGDLLNGSTSTQADLAIETLASLHVAWWEQPALAAMDWIPRQMLYGSETESGWKPIMQADWDRAWDCLNERFDRQITDPLAAAWPLMVQCRQALRAQSLTAPQTLCHGDYHLENMFFSTSGEDQSLVLFDWEQCRSSQGARDLAYFLVWSMETEIRREREDELMRTYCTRLKSRGVENYELDQCYRGYLITLYGFILPMLVDVASVVDLANDRARALAPTLIARVGEAIADHPLGDLIDKQ